MSCYVMCAYDPALQLVSPHPHLSSMEALMHACVKATPVSVVVPRLHAIPEHWNHSLPEIGGWRVTGNGRTGGK